LANTNVGKRKASIWPNFVSFENCAAIVKQHMIIIKINGETREIADDSFVSGAIESLKIASNGVAVAVNKKIVTKSEWETTSLQNHDEILIIKATQGG
jgi:sulfur carrier protein